MEKKSNAESQVAEIGGRESSGHGCCRAAFSGNQGEGFYSDGEFWGGRQVLGDGVLHGDRRHRRGAA